MRSTSSRLARRLAQESRRSDFLERNAVVDMERTIRENELNTEILVQQKQREVKETQLKAEIALEEQRAIWSTTRWLMSGKKRSRVRSL